MIATLWSDPLYMLYTETYNISFIRFDVVAIAWCGYVLFASSLKRL
jgi:hypothetical protein